MMFRVMFLMLSLGLLSLTACSSSGPGDADLTETSAPTVITPEARIYLQSLSNNSVQITAAIARIDEDLARAWPLRSMVFEAVRDSGVAAEVRNAFRSVSAIAPPDAFRGDYDLLVSASDDINDYAVTLEETSRRENLVDMSVALANLQVRYGTLLAGVSQEFCQAIAVADDATRFCDTESESSTAYERQVKSRFKRFAAEFGPRVGLFLPSMTDEERFDALGIVNLQVEASAASATLDISKLGPGEPNTANHSALVLYLSEIGETATAISDAGRARDGDEVRRLFAVSGEVAGRAQMEVSCEFNSAVLNGFFPSCREG